MTTINVKKRVAGRRRAAWVLLAAAVTATATQARPALAYNTTEHIRNSDQAYQALNLMRRGAAYAVQARRLDQGGAAEALAGKYQPLSRCPESVCPARSCPNGDCPAGQQWRRFVAQAVAAPAKLDRVRSDLADPDPKLVKESCGNELPKLGPRELALCRVGELSFAARPGWATSPNACFLRPDYVVGGADQNPYDVAHPELGPVLPFYYDLPSNLSGAAIGMWSTGPDEAQEDTKVWWRPTSTGFLGALREGAHAAADVASTAAVLIAAPFACFYSWWKGRNCFDDVRSVVHTAHRAGPEIVGVVEQNVFGRIDFSGSDAGLPLPGLWHFGHVEREGQFNEVPGMKFIAGGPGGEIDDLDYTIIAFTDGLGITLQSETSMGVKRYAPFADAGPRTVGDWIDPTITSVEFEPVQNLGQWGWTQFRDGKLGAKGLGWVLHALGDAGQPHHTISGVGWGHAAWERFANVAWQPGFREDDVVKHYPDLQKIVTIAFRWWKFLDDRQARTGAGDLAVRELIVAFLRETAQLPVSRVGRAFRKGVSSSDEPSLEQARDLYESEAPAMKELMQRAIGVSMAFLVKASDFVKTTGSSPCDCGQNAARFGKDASGKLVTPHDGLCHACGTGAFQGLPLWLDGACVAACPPDQPTALAGRCVAEGACPDETPFVEGGACVAACSGTNVVVNLRSCQAACPAPQHPDAAGFCTRLPSTAPRVCGASTDDVPQACCAPAGAPARSAADCCSRDRSPDGFCRGLPEDRCAIGDECRSLVCADHQCAPGANGGRCVDELDCASGICSEDHRCLGRAGDRCTSWDECDSATCVKTDPRNVVGACGEVFP
jgi:hypothetical protein